MQHKILIFTFVLICLSCSLLSAQKNHYRVAEPGLRKAYKQITGTSLEDAIDQLIAEKRGDRFANGNVIVRFNGGGTRNKLFIGRKNTLEILVENDYDIQGAGLGFKFTCSAGPGSFSWVQGYGTLPGGSDQYVKLHNDCFGSSTWIPQANVTARPDSLLLGGIAFFPAEYLNAQTSPTLLYSMQIEIPDNLSLVNDTFYIDNIVFPPSNGWKFQEAPPGSSIGYAPDFQWMPNQSPANPDAPPVGFPIAEPRCEFAGKSSNPNIIYIPNDSLKISDMPIDLDQFNIYGRDENAEIPITIGFTGKQEDLERLGIRVDWISEITISTSIKLNMLPLICQVKGVQRIKSQPIPDLELNYSTDDIDCVYSIVQPNLKVSGDGVIVGILDSGLDWLHEDFIDSNGNTRILAFWDQTDSSGLNPINPAFNFFSKHSKILFYKHC